MPQLTKAWIDRSTPKAKDYIIWDDMIAGFGCRIYPSKKTFIYRYRSPQNKKIISIKIGVYGSLTVDEARIQAKKFAYTVQVEKIDPKEIKEIKEKTKQVEAQQSISFEEFLTIFLERYPREAQWKASTFKTKSCLLRRHILPFFRQKSISEVQRRDVLEFKDLLQRIKIKNTQILNLLSTIFKQAALWEYRPRNTNPCEEVSKDADGKMERFLSEEELARLEKTLLAMETRRRSPYIINVFRLLIYTGCRKEEALSLEWEGFDRPDCCLRLQYSKTGKRTIPLNESAMRVLANVQKQEDNPYVFCGRKKATHLVKVDEAWYSIRKRAGLPDVRIHDLRHSFASFMIKNGVSLFELSKLLGHKSINTTMRYAHLADRELVNITNKGGKMFEANNKYFA